VEGVGGVGGEQAWKPEGGREGRVNEQMSGLAGGCWGCSGGKRFLLGVSPDRVRWRGVRHADKNNSLTIMLT